MEDFGDSEAAIAVVLFRTEDGSVTLRASEDATGTEIIGILETAKAVLLDSIVQEARAA
jgi:hypothetical protein